jgi:signal-transduction protein with cAMP-binding, CBS, and nucleotidyltransferase domain
VHENNRLSGLLTERDIVYAVAKKPRDLDKIKARDVRRRKIATIKPSADVYDALQKMRKTKYRWIPVLVNKNVIGFLTLKDILKIEPTLFDAVQEIGQIREEQAKIKRVRNTEQGKSWAREGLCEECGGYGLLYNQDGRLICENCFERM